MNKIAIGVDIDGVLANFSLAYGELLIEVSGKDLLPQGWRTNPEWPTTWYWEREAGYSKEVEKDVWENHILKNRSFWQDLEPLEWAPETVRQLNRLSVKGHNVYYITQRIGDGAKLQTERWLYELGSCYPTVCLVSNHLEKSPIIRALGLNFYIDDKAETVVDVSQLVVPGENTFHLFVKDAPYNRVQYPAGKVKVVGSVKEALETVGLW